MLALSIVLSVLGATAPAPATSGEPGPVVLLAQREVTDPGLRAALAELCGDEQPLELLLGEAVASGPAERTLSVPLRSVARTSSAEDAARVRAAPSIALVGMGFMDWYETLFPAEGPSRLAHALLDAHRRGTPIVGRGPAAGFVAGATMVPRATLKGVERDPHESAPAIALVGAAYGPPALVDAPGWEVGCPVELLLAMHETGVDLALFLEGQVAVAFTRGPKRLRVLGPGRVTLIDLDGARRRPRLLIGGRMSVLADGDGFDLDRERVLPAAGRDGPPPEAHPPLPVEAAFAARWLEAARSERAEHQLAGVFAPGSERPVLRFTCSRDEDTRRAVDEDGVETLDGLLFDVAWD